MTGRPETWARVPGVPGYQVSDMGRVRSLDRYVKARTGKLSHYQGQVLRPYPSGNNGYLTVQLPGGERRVHLLVLEAFAGPCPEGMEALHGPGGKLDNRWPENLCWGTRSENMLDKHRDGTMYQAKLTAGAVAACRVRSAAGEGTVTLAAEFGVAVGTMRDALQRRTWRHVP